MKLAFLCTVILSFTGIAFTQNIQIQVLPQPVIYQENDLVIRCSITNPSQLNSIFYIQLYQNTSTGFNSVVSVVTGQSPPIKWTSALQNRAVATGNIDTPNGAHLRLTIDKNSVECPTDFTEYKCKMSGLSSSDVVTQETNPVTVTYIVNPSVIEMPRVRILGEFSDTPARQFPVATALQLTCQGQVGNDASKTIRWCSHKSTDFTFTGLPQTPVHSEASLIGCQYTRSSTVTYNLTSTDIFTQFLCESGDTGMCGTGSAIQYVNITVVGNPTTNTRTADETSDAGIIAGGVIGGLAALILIILLVYFLVLRRKTEGETYRTKEEVPGYNGPANPEGPVYSVPVKDHPPERQPRRKHPRDEEDRRKHRGHDGHENQGLDHDHTPRPEKEEVDYQNHGYSNRMMNDYGDDGDVMPQGQVNFGSAV